MTVERKQPNMDVKEKKLVAWVEAYSDEMYSWAYYKTSDQNIAEDLVQDTFMAAFQAYDSFQGKSNPKTWLFSILNNKIKDYYRKHFRQQTVSIDHESSLFHQLFDKFDNWKKEHRPQKWEDDPPHLLDNLEFRSVFHSCLKKLPGTWFFAIQFKYLEEKDGKDICQELNISPSNFWQILHRAKLQVRACLENLWFKP